MAKSTLPKILIGILATVFIFHQVYSAVYKPITTQSAEFYTATDGLNITGFVIRKEHVIESDTQNVLHFAVKSGERVAKGGTVAELYDTTNASATVLKIEEIKQKIEDITEIQNYNDVQAADIELVNEKIRTALGELIFNSSSGDFAKCSQDTTELLSAVNRKQVITGEQTDFSKQLNALNEELNILNGSLPVSKGKIKAEVSGYFVSLTDGYENILDEKKLSEITPDYLSNLKPQKTNSGTVGKIVSDYEWFIAAKVPLNDSLKYKEGDTLSIKTSVKTSPVLPVMVERINLAEDSNSAVVIFSCNQMNSELASMRTAAMTVVNKEYSGLKVPKKALRVVDGKTGVYVVSGINVKFVHVNVIYNTADYIICEQKQTNDEPVLKLYDEVVVKGRKLYDGKVIG